MPDSNPIEQLRLQLAMRGCPARAARRIVRESAEHSEDLQRVALTSGLSPAEAAAQAAGQLGDPAMLAERYVAAMRKCRGLGWLPFLAFAVLPLAFLSACAFFIGVAAWLVYAFAERSRAGLHMGLLACAFTGLEALSLPVKVLNLVILLLFAGLMGVRLCLEVEPAVIHP